jgi:hypothetical protein
VIGERTGQADGARDGRPDLSRAPHAGQGHPTDLERFGVVGVIVAEPLGYLEGQPRLAGTSDSADRNQH